MRLATACGQTVEVGIDDELSAAGVAGAQGVSGGGGSVSGAGVGAGAEAGAGAGAEAGAPACVPTKCRGKALECGDCQDNDGDEQIDSLDSECLGPCDNDESALSTGVVGPEGSACRQDCYFDGDNGAGNDKCEWSLACDPRSVAPDYPPSGEERCAYMGGGVAMGLDCDALFNEQPPACREACEPLVPNGCDCFGCCELPGRSGDFRFIALSGLGNGCTLETVDDAATCPPCTPVPSCMNECSECEVCVGRPAPVGCDPQSACPVGQAACTTNAACDFQEYCVTGCCVRAPDPT